MCSLCVPLSVGLVPALRQGVVSVFSLCTSVCWSCAGITSGGSSCVLSVYPCLLDLCWYYVGGGGGSSCVLSVYPCLLDLCWHYVGGGGGVVHVFSLCTPVCWSCAGITSGGSFCVLSVYLCLLVLCRHYVKG